MKNLNESEKNLIAPVIILGEQKAELDGTAGTASKVLAFSEERRKLSTGDFIKRHIEVLADIFKVDEKEIASKPADYVILKFLECLEFVARTIARSVEKANNLENEKLAQV